MSSDTWGSLMDAAKKGSEVAPAGRYNLQVKSARADVARTGSDMIVARLTVADGPHAGKGLYNNFVLSVDNPTALSIFFQNMAAFGIGEDFFIARSGQTPQQTLAELADMLQGRYVVADVTIGDFGGRSRNEIRGVLKPVAAGVAPVMAPPVQRAPIPAAPQMPVPQAAPAPAYVQPPAPAYPQPAAPAYAQPPAPIQPPEVPF